MSSYEILGGKATFNILWTRNEFIEHNPRTFRAILTALQEAMALINQQPVEAAQIYQMQAGAVLEAGELVKIIQDPDVEYTLVPNKVMTYADFMHRIGMIRQQPESWRELFVAELHHTDGS